MEYKKSLYVIMEANYLKMQNNINTNDLFPNEWYTIEDYVLKTKILYDAITNNKKIEETESYKSIINN